MNAVAREVARTGSRLDEAVRQSEALERQPRTEDAVSGAVALFLDAYAAFNALEEDVRSGWATNAATYHAETDRSLDKLSTLSLRCASILKPVVDEAAVDLCELRRIGEFKRVYAEVLSIELMNNSACLPAHLAEAAGEAKDEFERERPG